MTASRYLTLLLALLGLLCVTERAAGAARPWRRSQTRRRRWRHGTARRRWRYGTVRRRWWRHGATWRHDPACHAGEPARRGTSWPGHEPSQSGNNHPPCRWQPARRWRLTWWWQSARRWRRLAWRRWQSARWWRRWIAWRRWQPARRWRLTWWWWQPARWWRVAWSRG